MRLLGGCVSLCGGYDARSQDEGLRGESGVYQNQNEAVQYPETFQTFQICQILVLYRAAQRLVKLAPVINLITLDFRFYKFYVVLFFYNLIVLN